MKKILVPIMILLSGLFVKADCKQIVKLYISGIQINKTGSTYEIKFNVNYADIKKDFFEGSRVALSMEKYFVTGISEKSTIRERDFLYAGTSFDLDGDGAFDSSFRLIYKGAYYSIGNNRIREVKAKKKYGNYYIYDFLHEGKLKSIKLSDSGIPFMVYTYYNQYEIFSAGLVDRGSEITLEYFQNPCVLVRILKQTPSLKEGAKFSISGSKNYSKFTNEKIFDDQEEWLQEVWSSSPVEINQSGKSEFAFTLSNIDGQFAVLISAAFSLQEGITLITAPSIRIIE